MIRALTHILSLKLKVIDQMNSRSMRANLPEIEVLDFFDRRAGLRAAHGLFMAEWLHLLPLSIRSAFQQCILGNMKNCQKPSCYIDIQ